MARSYNKEFCFEFCDWMNKYSSFRPLLHLWLTNIEWVLYSCAWGYFRPHYSSCISPFLHLECAGLCNSGPRDSNLALHKRTWTRDDFGKSIQEGAPGLQRGSKCKPPGPVDPIFQSDFRFSSMHSADWQLRQVLMIDTTNMSSLCGTNNFSVLISF